MAKHSKAPLRRFTIKIGTTTHSITSRKYAWEEVQELVPDVLVPGDVEEAWPFLIVFQSPTRGRITVSYADQ